MDLPFSVWLRLRWTLAQVLLLIAGLLAWLLRPLRKLAIPPAVVVALPQDRPSLTRTAATVRARADYDLVRIADKLDMHVDWGHRTVRAVPSPERYPLTMLPPKWMLLAALKVPLHGDRRWWTPEQPASACFPLRQPASARHWDDDLWFAAQRLQGPNPLFLEGVGDLERLDRLQLRGAVTGDPARLYAVDYRPMLRGCTPAPGRSLPPCVALFEATSDGLVPRLIQVESQDGPPVVFRPDGTDAWRLGRLYFGAADMLVHEVVAHYQWTHVLGETLAIVTARNLPWEHPLRGLLAPHLRGTLMQNANAAPLLVADGGLFDRCFAGGDCKHRLLEWGAANWSWERMILPRAIAGRGLEGLEDMPYRDDALLLWDAITAYVRGFVELWYDADRLRGDQELRSWSQELHDALGTPLAEDRETLIELLSGVVFNPVAHNLVNAPQYDTFGFPMGSPVALHVPVPTRPEDVDRDMLLRALPHTGDSLQATRATWGFTLQYDRFGRHLEPPLPAGSPALVSDLRDALAHAEETILTRNAGRRFEYLAALPSRVGNSVDA